MDDIKGVWVSKGADLLAQKTRMGQKRGAELETFGRGAQAGISARIRLSA
jgi:hypothetical protein